MSASDWWCTPPEIADPLEEFFAGPVDFDPCSNDRSVIKARKALFTGGLVLPWRLARPVGWSAYQNDPYSKASAWTDKMLHELKVGNVRELVRLSMCQPSCRWWGRMCNEPKQNPRILVTKRLSFLPCPCDEHDGIGDAACRLHAGHEPPCLAMVPGAAADKKRLTCRFEPALTYIGPRVREFEAAFRHLTRWSAWGRS